jgi:hypothetical protein
LHRKAQGHLREGLTADSCGAAPDLAGRRDGKPHRIPSWLINAITTPERSELLGPVLFVSTTRFCFVESCCRSARLPFAVNSSKSSLFAADVLRLENSLFLSKTPPRNKIDANHGTFSNAPNDKKSKRRLTPASMHIF